MRIAIDATPVSSRRKGVGVVLEGLISSARDGSRVASAINFVDKAFETEARTLWPNRKLRPVKIRSSLLWEARRLPRLLHQKKVDLLITTRDRTISKGRTRVLVWLFEVPDHRVELLRASPAPLRRKLIASASLRRFRKIAGKITHFVVSSEFTRNDLLTKYDIPADRITLIAPGISDAYRHATSTGSKPYVLHFATGDLRDNSDLALRAFAKATATVPEDVRLVLAGVPDSLRESLRHTALTLSIGHRVLLKGYVPAVEMPNLFASAAVYFDPTIFEGFGLQLLEAMAAGTPVITSSNSSAAEVVSDAGLLRAPDDEAGFVTALELLLNDPRQRAGYSALGRERAASYTWENASASMEKLIGELA